MSCRTDFKTISHYYTSKPYIKRYEQGICNRIYTFKSSRVIICEVDGKERMYITFVGKPVSSSLFEKFYTDLTDFLGEFNRRGLDKAFSPQEPAN